MEFDLRPVHVYGLQIRDRKIAKLVRVVLILSFLAAAGAITLAVLNFTIFQDQNRVAQTVISLIIGVTIPLFGWFGAWLSNRVLVGFFFMFSFLISLFNLVSYILVMVGIDYTIEVLKSCNSSGTVVVDGQVNTTICNSVTEDSLRNMYIIASAVSVPMILLQCLSGLFGGRLYGRMSPGIVITYQVDPPKNMVETFSYPQATVISDATVIGGPTKGKGNY